MLIAFLLGFLAGVVFMFLIGQGARSRRRSDQGLIDDRLADMTPSHAEATADTTEEGETQATVAAQATSEGEGADSELVGVMTREQSRDGNTPTEPEHEQALA